MKNLFFTLEGDSSKPAIVLGHPLGMNSQVWDGIVPELLEKFRVIRWDLPGHGLSAALDPNSSPLTANALVDPLIEKCDELGIKQFHYMGTSIGGVIGQQLLIQHSDRLLSATLTNTGAKIGTKDAWLTRQQDVMSLGLETMAATLVMRWFSEHSIHFHTTLASHWQMQLAKVDDHSYGALCAWLGNIDLSASLTTSAVPVQLICGEKDVATTPELMQSLASLLQINTVAVLPNVGHVPSVEAPEQLVPLLKTFLNP
ncbi:alpha/beta fold hydrolase [Marinomonas sp. IMCC 4694]|uniref:alpha/beta fold hydrolase n=1 Tax=Marinomonas sp. IMCC 4694 TaxID=2605432 RepID=UPI0011E80802|nr:alpha/beta fold hydrolase [Marinomonas sp. IMCC 4694]TYL46920.1 alpha/beta fold hydrolase [Marinomonas sp. IMCC 4694]